jgi:hypothetical protein
MPLRYILEQLRAKVASHPGTAGGDLGNGARPPGRNGFQSRTALPRRRASPLTERGIAHAHAIERRDGIVLMQACWHKDIVDRPTQSRWATESKIHISDQVLQPSFELAAPTIFRLANIVMSGVRVATRYRQQRLKDA